MITTFDIVGGADAERFTLKKGNKLTFKATAFKARALKAVALKVNLLPFFKVNLLASAPPTISKVVIMFLNKFVSLLLVISVITRFDRGFSPWAFPPSETAYKTLTVTVTKTNTGGNPDDDGEFYITTADISFVPENTGGVKSQCNGFDFNTISRITSGCKSRGFEN
jgi:hypothetical protein